MKTFLLNYWARPFRKAIFSYLLVIMISVMVYIVMYYNAFASLKKYAIESGIKGHDHGMELIETKIREINTLLNQIENERGLRTFINVTKPLTGNDYDNLYNLQKTINPYRIYNTEISDIVIYFGLSDVFLSTETASGRTQNVYEASFGYITPAYIDWKRQANTMSSAGQFGKSMEKHYSGQTRYVIPYVRKFPHDIIKDTQSVIMVTIEESVFREILQNVILPGTGTCYIIDDNQNFYFSYTAEGQEPVTLDVNDLNTMDRYTQKIINNNKYLVIKTHSQPLSLTCVSLVNLDSMLYDITRLQAAFKIVLLITLVAEMAISILFALRNSRPIYELSQWIKDLFSQLSSQELSADDDFGLIKESISYLYNRSVELKASLDKQEIMTRTIHLSQLLGINYSSGNYTDKDFALLPFNSTANGYVVVTISIFRYLASDHLDSSQALNQIQLLIVGLAEKILKVQLANLCYDRSKVALILESPSDKAEDDLRLNLNRLIVIMRDQYEVGINAGIGNTVENPFWIRHSFSEAKMALLYGDQAGVDVMEYDQIPPFDETCSYSIDADHKVLQLILSGKCENAQALIKSIYLDNLQNGAVPEHMEQLISGIQSTLAKASQHAAFRDSNRARELRYLLNGIEHKDSLTQQYVEIQNIVKYMCDELNSSYRSSGHGLVQQIIDYVFENYMDFDMCLDTLAERFNLSAKYLSQFFKRQTGINFVKYLHGIRLGKAQELLKTTTLDISQISTDCGYANINTFYKAFQRHCGTSPGAYRDSL